MSFQPYQVGVLSAGAPPYESGYCYGPHTDGHSTVGIANGILLSPFIPRNSLEFDAVVLNKIASGIPQVYLGIYDAEGQPIWRSNDVGASGTGAFIVPASGTLLANRVHWLGFNCNWSNIFEEANDTLETTDGSIDVGLPDPSLWGQGPGMALFQTQSAQQLPASLNFSNFQPGYRGAYMRLRVT